MSDHRREDLLRQTEDWIAAIEEAPTERDGMAMLPLLRDLCRALGGGTNEKKGPRCIKCGGSDIYTRYRAVGDTLDEGFGTDRSYFDRLEKECLRSGCRTCGYRWVDPVLPAPDAKS